MRQIIRGYAIAALALSLGCGGKSSNTPNNVTVTGQLQSGGVTHVSSGPLVGYTLYCVTFGSQPVAASGTADTSGNVSLTFAAQGVAFGCFVQDTSGNTVATLSFQAGSATGTTLTLSGSASLGTITVDLSTGLASASVTSGTVASTPPGSTCPLGTWIFQTGASEPACTSTAANSTAKVWVAPTANGGCCTVSLIHGPESHGQGICSYSSYSGLAGVYASGTLTFGPFNGNSGGSCPNRITVQMSPSADCTTATAALHFEGCYGCSGGPQYCPGSGTSACGSSTCNATVNGTRQQ